MENPALEKAERQERSGTVPDFFVIGAAKSGTTSLYYYLRQHPGLFLPDVKELNYFSYDPDRDEALVGPGTGPGDREATVWTSSLSEYQQWFESKEPGQVAGEVAGSYLYSPVSARRIGALAPEAKLIAILRNPVDRAWSGYCHMRRDGREELAFMEALQQEEERIDRGWEFSWHYKRVGLYGQQLKRFYDVFPPENIKVFLFEEFTGDTERVVGEILSFLGVDERVDLAIDAVHNQSGAVRNGLIARFISRPSRLTAYLRNIIPQNIGHRVMELVRSVNTTEDKPEMPAEARAYLTDFYAEDVEETERLLQKDLLHWIDRERQDPQQESL